MFLLGILLIYFLVNRNSAELFENIPNLNTAQNNLIQVNNISPSANTSLDTTLPTTLATISNNTDINKVTNVINSVLNGVSSTPTNNILNEKVIDLQQALKNEILEIDTVPKASENIVETGNCYRPNTDTSSSTSELDTSLINQMSQVEDVEEYLHIVNTMRQKYKNKLNDTINLLNNTQNDITNGLNDVQREFNKYGMEMLSKQYYDTIYKYGSFEEVKDRIRLPQLNDKNEVTKLKNNSINNVNSINNANSINNVNSINNANSINKINNNISNFMNETNNLF
jgi:hypothetical protein